MKRFILNVAGLFVAIVAVLFGLPSLYLMAAILWLIPVVSFFMGWLMLGGLESKRDLPLSATAGEPIRLTYTLTNRGRLPKFYLLVRDTLPRGVRPAAGPAPLILGLWPGEQRETGCLLEARQRGVFSLGPAQVYSTDPLGLQTFSRKMPALSELVVYPAALPLRGSWLSGAASGWQSASSASARGDGDDFHGVREYGPGDELRRVHWRTTARTGTLAVTEYAQGITLEVTVALDLSQQAYQGTGTDEHSALEVAVTLAATLLTTLLQQGHRVRLVCAGTGGDSLSARSPDEIPRFLERLARVQADSLQTLAEIISENRLGSRLGTVLAITPDWPSGRLAEALKEGDAGRGRSVVFALDADSFRTGRPGLPDTLGGPEVRLIRRGADLSALLETPGGDLERQHHG